MTTGTEPEGQVDAREVWRAIGRLEGSVDALKEDVREIRDDQRQIREELSEIRAALVEVNRRVDRVYYTMLGMGGALLAAIFASRFVGN